MAEQKAPSPAYVYTWDEANRLTDLEHLYQDTCKKVRDNIGWYTRNAKAKKTWAQTMRVLSLVLLGVGGALPVVIDVFNLGISPSIATLVIAAGTGLVAFDRYMGYSTAWMRFITSELFMKGRLEAFEYEWENERLGWAGETPTIEQTRLMISRCAAFRKEIATLVQDETHLWVQEFQSNLKLLDDNFKTLVEANRTGAISLTVENGDACEGGWNLEVDDRLVGTYAGNSTAITNLMPGFRKLAVIARNAKGETGQKVVTLVNIEPGQMVNQAITLPAVNGGAGQNGAH